LFHEEQIFELIGNQEPRRVLSSSIPRIAPNAVSAFIAMQYKFRGTNLTISTACSSGGNAIALAAQKILSGETDIVITGGVECPISPFTYAAYQSLRVLSKGMQGAKTASKPFDKKRDGFVLGEGAGILILENYAKACARKAVIYAELKGWGSNCGAYHMAAPDPSGGDAAAVMREAVEQSDLQPSEIDYINAHGTATQANDVCESRAINVVFEKKEKGPWVSSTKSQIGHTIGASGAIGAIAAILAVKNDIIPPNINCDELDEQCDIRVAQGKSLQSRVRNALCNSFGFGSNNTALVFGKMKS
jgi:3-oxoacyl-[acyl-carrier-protein] synthase II